jgi:HK97 gp10 family phage protein
MADKVKIVFLGVKDLGRRLELAKGFIRSMELRKVLEDASNTMGAMARKAVPKKSYLLHSKIFSEVRAFSTDNPHIVLGTVKSTYAKYVEEGTKPHAIRPRVKKWLYWQSQGPRGQKIPSAPGIIGPKGFETFRKEVWHPGTKAQPFIGPTVERIRPRLVLAISRVLNNYLKGQA